MNGVYLVCFVIPVVFAKKNPEVTEASPKNGLFSVVLVVSVFTILAQILVSIFGPKMKDEPFRWHTLNCCCWNSFQLLIFANCAFQSVFQDFLANKFLAENCENIQAMTLSVFHFSMLLQVPITFLFYFKPKLVRLPVFKFYFWIPVYFLVDVGIFMLYGSNFWGWRDEIEQPVDPLHVFQAAASFLFQLLELAYILALLCAIVRFIFYFCQYFGRPDSQVSSRFVNLINLVCFGIYVFVVGALHFPTTQWIAGQFLLPYIYDLLRPIMDFVNSYTLFLYNISEVCTLFIPLAEFFATILFIPMYRSQFLHFITCGQSTHKPQSIRSPQIPGFFEMPKVAPSDFPQNCQTNKCPL